jgi:hypothetical protein
VRSVSVVHKRPRKNIRREEDRALHHVAQLADVAGPRVRLEERERRGREERDVVALRLLASVVDEGRREALDLVHALAQRRDGDGDAVEAKIEVLPEAAIGDLLFEIAVRRGDEADVDRLRLQAADALHLAILDHAEELGLRALRHLAELVEEHGAAVRRLEEAGLGDDGARESAALVAEQLALEELLGEGRAVEAEERLRRARGLAVDRLGHDLFADARLAEQEHAVGAGSHWEDGVRSAEAELRLAERSP